MNGRTLTAATLAAVTGSMLWYYVGEEPGCYEILAVCECEAAKNLATEEIACRDGSIVTVPIEVRVTGPDDDYELPRGCRLHGDKPTPLDCRELQRSEPVTVRPVEQTRGRALCMAGLVSKNVGDGRERWRTWEQPHVCCGDRCRCDDPRGCATVLQAESAETWRARVDERESEGRDVEAR